MPLRPKGNVRKCGTDAGWALGRDSIRKHALLMGGKVEHMLAASLRAFESGDVLLARRTIALDAEIDRLEVDLDEQCLRALARRHPVASDLRLITAVLKLVTKLERIADLGELICRRVMQIHCDGGLALAAHDCHTLLCSMGRLVSAMVRDALDAFAAGDAVLAREVIARDSDVDLQYARSFPLLLELMTTRSELVPTAVALSSVGKALERIGDEASDVADLVCFVVEPTPRALSARA